MNSAVGTYESGAAKGRGRMRATARAIAIVTLAYALLAPLSAKAVVYSECGGTYIESSQCTFFAGSYLSVVATTFTGNYLTVNISDPTGNVWLLHCRAYGFGSSCSAGSGLMLIADLVPLPAGVPLTCSVVGGGSGQYRCGGHV